MRVVFALFLVFVAALKSSYAEQLKNELEPYSEELQRRAEAGDPQAQFLMGYNKLNGKGTPKNEQEAIRWYVLSAEKGHVRAMNTLGTFFLKNKIDSPETDAEMAKGTPEISFSKAKRDKTQPHHIQMAVFWFMQAADKGNPRAKANIGILYSEGLGLEKSDTEAIRWWEEAASEGAVNAQYCLSLALKDGKGMQNNPQRAFELMYLAANQKADDESEIKIIAKAQNALSTYYYYGLGVDKNLEESFNWNQKSAEAGDPIGQHNLGTAYKNGEGVAKNLGEAIKWYQKSAEQGYEKSLYELGYLNANGIGMEQNYKKAFEYYLKAAQKGDAKAQNNLGVLFLEGRGTKKNEAEAFRYFLRSSLQNNVVAFGNLATCYENGRGVEVSTSEAFKWYGKGAEADVAVCQYKLAQFYEKGIGTPKNTNLAKEWYERAEKQGYAPAKKALKSSDNNATR